MMKKLLYLFLVFAVLGLFVLIFAFINQDKLIDRFIEQQADTVTRNQHFLDDTVGIRLITVGTTSPIPSERVQSCNVVFVNGRIFVFDVGEGASKKIETLGLPINKIEDVFISHWHSDHFIDLPNLINRTWQLGRTTSINIHGPGHVDSILQGINMMLHLENRYRVAHHGSDAMNPEYAKGVGHSIQTNGTDHAVVYDRDGITITAFLVEHEPVNQSYGFRIDYNGHTAVISGDTKKSNQIVKYAKDADLLVHEAMQIDFIKRAADLQSERGNDRNAKILNDVVDYHTSPIEAAEVAQEAGVKLLVLSHLAPVPENPISRRFFTDGLDDVFNGDIELAEDGNEYYIK